jgi:hypothetical protein
MAHLKAKQANKARPLLTALATTAEDTFYRERASKILQRLKD